VVVTLIVGLRSVSFDVADPASELLGDAGHDLGLCTSESALDAGQVRVAEFDGQGEFAQAVAALFALPPNFESVWLHNQNHTQRDPATQAETQRHSTNASVCAWCEDSLWLAPSRPNAPWH
jgi:hypothetical protein